MNLWLRLLAFLLTAPFRPSLAPPSGVSRLAFRVWPNDLDINLHMNNGRYLTIMDIGRFDLTLRMGLAGHARRNGWMPILSAAHVLYRRELRLFQRFWLESRIVWWSGARFIIEHRILTRGKDGGDDELAARALMLGGVYQRKARRFVPVEEILEKVGLSAQSPPAAADVEAILNAVEMQRAAAKAQGPDGL